jgi:hypothetical protein
MGDSKSFRSDLPSSIAWLKKQGNFDVDGPPILTPALNPAAGAIIELAPTVLTPMDGMFVRRRVPHADRDTQVVHRLESLGIARLTWPDVALPMILRLCSASAA